MSLQSNHPRCSKDWLLWLRNGWSDVLAVVARVGRMVTLVASVWSVVVVVQVLVKWL